MQGRKGHAALPRINAMTIGPLKNMAASVHDRLLKKARETNRPFQELFQYYAMERFLFRLSKSPHRDKLVLKGALMLKVWKAPESRPTMDIDFLGKTENRVDSILKIVEDVCGQEVESDGIIFDISDVDGINITEDAQYKGVRIIFVARLDRAKVPMQVDIGFGDIVMPSVQAIVYPSLLGTHSFPLKGYSRESVVAEKFEAIVKLGLLNSRMKDFYDIFLLCRQYDFDGENLAKAIMETFSHRATTLIDNPIAFTEEFINDPGKKAQWRAFIKKSQIENVPDDLGDVISAIALFLSPVAKSLINGVSFKLQWDNSGTWR